MNVVIQVYLQTCGEQGLSNADYLRDLSEALHIKGQLLQMTLQYPYGLINSTTTQLHIHILLKKYLSEGNRDRERERDSKRRGQMEA